MIRDLPNGWTLKKLVTEEELEHENNSLFDGRGCLTRGPWLQRFEEGYFLFSLRDEDNNSKALVLAANAELVIRARAGSDYYPYAGSKIFDQKPRQILDDACVMTLEFCPKGENYWGRGDVDMKEEETQMFKEWYESLPVPNEYEDFDANNPMTRTVYSNFLRERGTRVLTNS